MEPEEQNMQKKLKKSMFGAIALGALWHSFELIHFLVCATRVLRSGSKKVPKHLKINGLGRFRGTHVGGPTSAKSVPLQRGTRFAFCRSAPMQRGVRGPYLFPLFLKG